MASPPLSVSSRPSPRDVSPSSGAGSRAQKRRRRVSRPAQTRPLTRPSATRPHTCLAVRRWCWHINSVGSSTVMMWLLQRVAVLLKFSGRAADIGLVEPLGRPRGEPRLPRLLIRSLGRLTGRPGSPPAVEWSSRRGGGFTPVPRRWRAPVRRLSHPTTYAQALVIWRHRLAGSSCPRTSPAFSTSRVLRRASVIARPPSGRVPRTSKSPPGLASQRALPTALR